MNGLPQVDWEALAAHLETLESSRWNPAVRAWLHELTGRLGSAYSLTDVENVALVSPLDRAEAEEAARFVRRSLRQIRGALGPLCPDDDDYVRVVLLFADARRYYDYVSHYDSEEGRWGGEGGRLIRDGYLHIVGMIGGAGCRSMIAHELTHLVLTQRGLPLWLEEGLTQAMEEWITGASGFHVDREIMDRHRKCWRAHGIQCYWDGGAFSAPDERQELAYHLSQVLVRPQLADRNRAFLAFVADATWEDYGAAAARSHLGESLGQLASRCLGPGDWEPSFEGPS